MNILEVQRMKKAFGGVQAINDVTISFKKGETVSIIGPNGAGKTTLFNLITGFVKPDSGRILFKGKNITHLPHYKISRLGIGRSFQRSSVFPELTVFENIRAAVISREGKTFNLLTNVANLKKERDVSLKLLEEIGLEHAAGVKAAALSHGELKILDVGMALALNPEVLLLDEPTAGIPTVDRPKIMERISKISKNRGLTVIFVDHDMDVVFGFSERVVVLNYGNVLADGPPGEVGENDEVLEAYLGKED
ncbi:MAG: ABC transporter ATP-binding protein [Candidatus Methanomethylicaceae archaeon]